MVKKLQSKYRRKQRVKKKKKKNPCDLKPKTLFCRVQAYRGQEKCCNFDSNNIEFCPSFAGL